MAHLHDFRFEILHSYVCTVVLAALPCVGWSFHVRQQCHFRNPQRIDYDMHMNVAAVVIPVRVGTDKGLVSGEMLFTKLLAQCLRPVYGQAVVCRVTEVKTDDIVVALYVLLFLVLAVFEIRAHTGYLPVFIQRGLW